MNAVMSLWLGLTAGAVAGLMAFLIVYNEMRKHRMANGRAWKEALRMAVVAFALFLGLALVSGYLLRQIIR